MGIIRGKIGYSLLRSLVGISPGNEETSAYDGRSKLEILFGPNIWGELANKTVLDFGCATGVESIDIAQHGAARVIGIDTREDALAKARERADEAGVGNRCLFATGIKEQVDIVISLDAFEHFADPLSELRVMRRLLKDDGCILACFGPTWYHPLGGHGFSIFPWAHLLFSEDVLMRWYREKSNSNAQRFGEIRGGLNQLTIRKFETIIKKSEFEFERLEVIPIRKLRLLANRITREFTTSVIRCKLVPRHR